MLPRLHSLERFDYVSAAEAEAICGSDLICMLRPYIYVERPNPLWQAYTLPYRGHVLPIKRMQPTSKCKRTPLANWMRPSTLYAQDDACAIVVSLSEVVANPTELGEARRVSLI